jgi:ankyrin repeat protein
VKYLVEEKGADVKAVDVYGNTPLHRASQNGHLDVVKYLVEKGADFQAVDKVGDTPLHDASYYGKLDVVKYLVEKALMLRLLTIMATLPCTWLLMVVNWM